MNANTTVSGRVAIISRSTVFNGYGALRAFKTLYDVALLGAPALKGFSTISEAERMARKHGATEVIRSWSQP